MKSRGWWLLLLILPCCAPAPDSSSNDDQKTVILNFLLKDIDSTLESECLTKAEAEWAELTGTPGALQKKIEAVKTWGYNFRSKVDETILPTGLNNVQTENTLLGRKVRLYLRSGDTRLHTDQWNKLVQFSEPAIHHIRFSVDYDCGEVTTSCTYSDLLNAMSKQTDEKLLRSMKESWEHKLPNPTKYESEILPLLSNAAKENGYNNVVQYWEALTELSDGVRRARKLWDQVRPLYDKLLKYVILRLKIEDFVNPDTSIPVHLLGSPIGEDWLNLADRVVPPNAQIYQQITKNLNLKSLGGRVAFKQAAKLLNALKFEDIDPRFDRDSVFDKMCPPSLVDFCQSSIRVSTCNHISLGNYLDAHETLMEVKRRELAAASSSNYVLLHANRHSALNEALGGVLSLIAMSPHALDHAGLFPLQDFSLKPNDYRTFLQLVLALRDLPRLNYYLAVDEWRLQKLANGVTLGKNWSDFRRNYSQVVPEDNDLLGDKHVLTNTPYLGKFLGTILKYQIYQSFASGLPNDEDDIVEYIGNNNRRLSDAMSTGYSGKWPSMLRAIFADTEDEIDATGITDYFKLLDQFLEAQLKSPEENDIKDYEAILNQLDLEQNNLDVVETKNEDVYNNHNVHEIPNDIEGNMLEANPAMETKDRKADIRLPETTSEDYSDNNNLISKEEAMRETKNDGKIVSASYQMYLWIGLAILIAIIAILILIVARKRHNHRKQLEKQRNQGMKA